MRGPKCPPRIDLERVAAGEDVSEVAAHVSGCADCQQLVTSLRAEAEAFLRARPTTRFLGQLEARATRKPAPKWGLVLAGLLAASAIVFVAWPRPPEGPVQFKGALATIFVRRDGAVQALRAGDTVHPGDALRFQVTVERAGYALVLNRDGRGKVTVVAPFGATQAQAIGEGTTVLDDSAVLDEAAGRETFLTIVARQPFEAAPLVRQWQAGAAVQCGDCRVDEVSFEKR